MSQHQFSREQQKLMSNFNVRYECYDAKDDFSRQMRKGVIRDGLFMWGDETLMQQIRESNGETESLPSYNAVR